MKNLFRIKWENISLIIFGSFFTYCIINHISKNGFNLSNVMFEVLIYGLILALNYTSVWGFRKSFLEERK